MPALRWQGAGPRQSKAVTGYDAVPADYEVEGELSYQPLSVNLDDLRLRALKLRPDLLAATTGYSGSAKPDRAGQGQRKSRSDRGLRIATF